MAIPKFNIPNLCGASPELNNALSKIADLKDSINVNINLNASAAADALNSKLADVKAGLDGLAPDLPAIPNVNFQSELTSLVSDFDLSTPQGLLDFNIKKIELEGKFGDALTKAGKSFDSLISDATSAVAGGGDVCALAPNLELPAGVTAEEIKEGTAAAVEKAQGVKTALENGKIEIPSEVKINDSVSIAREALKAAKEEKKNLVSLSSPNNTTVKITKVDEVKVEKTVTKVENQPPIETVSTKTTNTTKIEKVTTSGGGVIERKATKKANYAPQGIRYKPTTYTEYFCDSNFKELLKGRKNKSGRSMDRLNLYVRAKVVEGNGLAYVIPSRKVDKILYIRAVNYTLGDPALNQDPNLIYKKNRKFYSSSRKEKNYKEGTRLFYRWDTVNGGLVFYMDMRKFMWVSVTYQTFKKIQSGVSG